MKSLYLDFDLSISQIEELTDSKWKHTSIVKALEKMGISKATALSRTKYGEKVAYGKIVPHPQEQKIIKIMLSMRKKGISFEKIAQYLNENKIRSKLGLTWSRKIVKLVVDREQNKRKEISA